MNLTEEREGHRGSCVRGPGFWTQFAEVSSSLRVADLLVFGLIICFGALQFFCAQRSNDFLSDDAFSVDSARSIIEHGLYGINGYAETNMPPGLALLIALLCVAGSCSHLVILRLTVVFGTLGFLASYELLRRQVPRGVAAAICLLVISSPVYFEFVTQWVESCFPYFFTAMCVLLVAGKFENATRLNSRLGWGALLAVLIAVSLMFVSAAMAFLGAIVAIIAVMLFRDKRLAFTRLKSYLAILLVGVAVQGFWMNRGKIEASAGIGADEWPVAGFPHSYLAQLKVKSGDHPELGMATAGDIPVRIFKNACGYANLLNLALFRLAPQPGAWMGILIFGPLLLIALGWCYSTWLTGGGLQEWYFAGHAFIYLLWPWDPVLGYFLPVVPLACLYGWHGAKALVMLSKYQPRMFGVVWFPVAVLLAVNAWFWMHESLPTTRLVHAELSFAVWLLSAILALWMIWANTGWLTSVSVLVRRYALPIGALRISPLRISQGLSIVAVAGLILVGLRQQLEIGRANLDPNSDLNRIRPDAEAAVWIRSHSEPNAVVMARMVPTAYHYSKRKVIWFPPSSNPQLLMEGILKHRIDFIIVSRQEHYLPSDDACFAPLLKAYPDKFRLVCQAPLFRIFQVARVLDPVRTAALEKRSASPGRVAEPRQYSSPGSQGSPV